MRIVCIDDEPLALEDIITVCGSLSSEISVKGFTSAIEALEWIRTNPVDIALLDIDMPVMNGILLAVRVKQIKPDTAILFLTAYKDFAYDAIQVHPDGYLLKPVMPEKLKKEIDYAMSVHPKTDAPHIEARTFGSFELLADGETVRFKRSKSKELLAYLIDRQGRSVPRSNIAAVLFEDAPYDHSHQKYLDAIIRSLRDTLREYGIEEILQMERKGLRVVPEKLDCDMFRFYRGDADAIKAYRGEYMDPYAWANIIEGDLLSILENRDPQ